MIGCKWSILSDTTATHPEGIEEYRDEAKQAADEAKQAAEDVKDATVAKQTADEAKAIAEEALSIAQAGGGGNGVDEEARALANEAKADANNAMSAATDAISYADNAIGTANQAKTVAQEAKSAVDGMADAVLSAGQDANAALQKANEAIGKFDEVDGRLYNAEGQAGDAYNYANEAKNLANTASSDASTAKLMADDALGKAQQALEQSSGSNDATYLMRYTYRALQITADLNPWGGCIGDGSQAYHTRRGIAMLEKNEGASLQSMLEGGKYSEAKVIIMHPNYTGVLNYYNMCGSVQHVLVAKGVTRIEETSGASTHVLDLTMFTGDYVPQLTQDATGFTKILVAPNKKQVLANMTNWSNFADIIEEVEIW